MWQQKKCINGFDIKVVYTFVVGDFFHIGHIRAIEDAHKMGDVLIVGVLTDEAVASYKRTPVMKFWERMEIVRNLKNVDLVVPQDSKDPTENLKILRPDIVCHADDWGEDFEGAEYMRSIGKEAKTFGYHREVRSTTEII